MFYEYTINDKTHHIMFKDTDYVLLIKINKRNNYAETSFIENAMKNLSANAFSIYTFLAIKPKDFIWCMPISFTTPSITSETDLSCAFVELLEKGYLQYIDYPLTNLQTGEVEEQPIYEFHELPVINSIKKVRRF